MNNLEKYINLEAEISAKQDKKGNVISKIKGNSIMILSVFAAIVSQLRYSSEIPKEDLEFAFKLGLSENINEREKK